MRVGMKSAVGSLAGVLTSAVLYTTADAQANPERNAYFGETTFA